MDKYTLLKELIYKYNSNTDLILAKFSKNNSKDLNIELLLSVISKPAYNLTELGISSATITKLLKELFPTRDTNSTGVKPCNFLFRQFSYKWCSKCNDVKLVTDFRPNKSQKCGLNSLCKTCQDETTAKTQPYRQKKYQSAKLDRIPSWANMDIIKIIYECAEGDHVDHIIPLQGDKVCGLHVETNLQYLSPHDNIVKHNKFITDWE